MSKRKADELSQENYHPTLKVETGDGVEKSVLQVVQAVVPSLKEAYEKVKISRRWCQSGQKFD